MYSYEDLAKYDYFKDIDIEHALDSLTGVLTRGYILGFAQKLIEDNIPFAMCILDIDNFKLINDNYGHLAGDICLKSIGNSFVEIMADKGLVGRYGGDEFVFLYLKANDYDSVHEFLASLYGTTGVVRKTYKLDNVQTFVTGTIGSASFPIDANNYDDLFIKVDKALYRGKTKGRNCFIVYVDEKHKNIDVHRRENTSLPLIYDAVLNIFNNNKSKDEIIKNSVNYVNDLLQLGMTFVVSSKDNKVISSGNNIPYYYDRAYIDYIGELMADKNIFYSSDLTDLKDESPYAMEYLTANNIQSIIISKIQANGEIFGYLVLYENKIIRIWQENDIALAMYLESLFAMLFLTNKK